MKCLSFLLALLTSGFLLAQTNQPSATDQALDWLASKVAPPGSSKEDIELAREVCKYAVGARGDIPGMDATKSPQAQELVQNSTVFHKALPLLRTSALSQEDKACVLSSAMTPLSRTLSTRNEDSAVFDGLRITYVGTERAPEEGVGYGFGSSTVQIDVAAGIRQMFPEAAVVDCSRDPSSIDWENTEIVLVGEYWQRPNKDAKSPVQRIDQSRVWAFVNAGGLLIVREQSGDEFKSWLPGGERVEETDIYFRWPEGVPGGSYPTSSCMNGLADAILEDPGYPGYGFARWSGSFRPLAADVCGHATMLELDVGAGKLLLFSCTSYPNHRSINWKATYRHVRAYVNWRGDLVKSVRAENEANPARRKPPESRDTSATSAPQTPAPGTPASPLAQIDQKYLWVGGGVVVVLVLIAVIAGRKRSPRQSS